MTPVLSDTSAASNCILIRWNKLCMAIPAAWNVIIKAPRHLIFERRLQPFLEIRWQPPDIKNDARQRSKILQQFEREIGRPLKLIGAARLPSKTRSGYEVQGFNWDDSRVAQALLLTCRSCATHLLIRCYGDSFTWLCENPAVLESLVCHLQEGEEDWWNIQDVRVVIPEGFQLDSCSFRFGLSDLLFINKSNHLRLCRLAPASTYLAQHDFAALFESLCSAPREKQQAGDSLTRFYRNRPHPGERLLGRLRKRRCYHSARFRHYPQFDRILGYSLRSAVPIDRRMEDDLQRSYGIIKEEKYDAAPDP